MFYITIGLLCMTVLPQCSCLAQLQILNTGRTGAAGNNVQLECRDRQSGLSLTGASFWLNMISPSQELRALIGNVENSIGQINFTITRDLEGTYYCGRNEDDVSIEGVQLIGE